MCLFTMQRLEKLNDLSTQHYFRSTNRQVDYLFQSIRKRNRVEILSVYEEDEFYNKFSQAFSFNPYNNRNK